MTSTGFELVTSRRVQCSNQLSYEATALSQSGFSDIV